MNLSLTAINIYTKFLYKKFIKIRPDSPKYVPVIHIRFTQSCYYIDVEENRSSQRRFEE